MLISASAFAQSLFVDKGSHAYGISFSYIYARKNAVAASIGASNNGIIDLGASVIYTRLQRSPVVISPYLGFLPIKQNRYFPPVSLGISAAFETPTGDFENIFDFGLLLSSCFGSPAFSVHPIIEGQYSRELVHDGLEVKAIGFSLALSPRVSDKIKLVVTPSKVIPDEGHTTYSIGLGIIIFK
jgi:hypothetical protein